MSPPRIKQRSLYLILIVWLLLMGGIKTIQHLSFGTNACDLSTQDYALASTLRGDFMADPFHQFAFGRWQRDGDNLDFAPGRVDGWQSHFAVHFTPILVLLLPLYALFPGPLVLIYLELAAVALSAWFLFHIARSLLPDSRLAPAAITVVYLLFRQMVIAVSHDFHFELLFPVLFLGAHYLLTVRRTTTWSFLLIGLALLVKEDMGIYLFFYGLFVAFKLKERRFGAVTAAVSLAYSIAAIGWILPAFRAAAGGGGSYVFGEVYGMGSPFGIVVRLAASPWLLLQGVDFQAFLRALGSGILLPLLFLPLLTSYGLLILPVAAVALASKLPQMYTFGIHYSVPLLPFLFLALLHGFAKLERLGARRPAGTRRRVAPAILVLLVVVNLANSSLWRCLEPGRYRALSTRASVMDLIRRIPPEASVAAQSALIPHIPKRRMIDMLPLGLAHQYVLVHAGVNLWPYTRSEFENLLRRLDSDGRYELLDQRGEARLYRRLDGRPAGRPLP